VNELADQKTEMAAQTVLAGRYELRRELGAGGMGAVYRAHDRELGEDIALKVLKRALARDAAAVDRFRREVKLARRVTHPNVARTYDLGRDGDLCFLTMELVEGEALTALVRGAERPPLAESLRIAEHVARGLSAAHAAGVVHRDLKPENVIRGPGTSGRVVITDFGIARQAESSAENLTGSQIIGTPSYMAPEQLTADTIDGRTDVYALGTLLFEMLTGALPFRRDSLSASIAARVMEDPPDPRRLDPGMPEPVALLVLAALARRREDRLDAPSLLQAIERLRGGGDRHDVALTTELRAPSRRIGVLPVDGAPHLAGALADALTSVRGVEVVREESRASWLVECALRSEGGRGRARVRFLDADRGVHVLAVGPIEFDPADSFALEDRLVAAVTDGARELMGDGAVGPADANVRAYIDRARSAAQGRTIHGVNEAVGVLDEGLAKFPGDAWLMSSLGAELVRLYGLTGSTDPALAARAEEMSLRALASDPTLGEAYRAVGALRLEQGDTRGAVRAFREALVRAPRIADSHAALAIVLAETGHVAEARRRFDIALRLDPRALVAHVERARLLALLGDRVTAEADLAAVGEPAIHPLLVRAVFWWNDRARAEALADTFERKPTGAPWEAGAPLLRVFARGEPFPAADVVFTALAERAHAADRTRCRVLEAAADYFGATGDRERALAWIERVERYPFVNLLWMDRSSCLDAIRLDPRFTRMRSLVAARAAEIWR
jgi:serine/threonine-protein kinase